MVTGLLTKRPGRRRVAIMLDLGWPFRRHVDVFVGTQLYAREAGWVKLGHVVLDGTKIKANASKHKAMSYGRMCEREKELEREVTVLLKEAEAADTAEDAKYGRGKRGDELPAELARRESRLKKIWEAKAALEAQAREEAAAKAEEVKRRLAAMPDVEGARPEPKAQRNFTDPESRIMKDGASHGFEQCYNAQAAVDGAGRVIVAADVTQETNDKQQLVPMFKQVKENVGRMPRRGSADAGYFGEEQLTDESLKGVRLYVPQDRQAHGGDDGGSSKPGKPRTALAERMRRKLSSVAGRAIYKMRKAIAEPVFGQIKERRGFSRFSFRGLANVSAEWKLIALTHNLLDLFQAVMA